MGFFGGGPSRVRVSRVAARDIGMRFWAFGNDAGGIEPIPQNTPY